MRLRPVLALFPAGFVYEVLPRGVFGAYDIAMRAAICGATAAATAWLLIEWNKRSARASH